MPEGLPGRSIADTSDSLRASFEGEERLGEATVSRLRLWALAIFYVNELVNYYVLGAWGWEFHSRVRLLAAAWAMFAVASWLLLHRTRVFHPSLKYIFSTADVLFITGLLFIGNGPRSPSFILYYVAIGTSNLRYRGRLTVYTTGLCATAYLALYRWAGARSPELSVPGFVAVVYILGMVVTGVLSGYVVERLKNLVRGFVENLVRRQLVERALSRYVSYQVAEKILQSIDSLEDLRGERRYVTMLMADIRGFTQLCSRLSPEEVVALLNGYFERVVAIVFEFDGTLDKFMGDAVLVVFGAPTEQADSEARAVRCAWRLQEMAAGYSRERRVQGLEEIHIGIGINAGEVVAGNVGSKQRLEYTVLGDAVNLTQRFCAAAGRGQTLLSEAVYRRVSRLVDARPLGPLPVKGKAEPMAAYELLGLRPADPGSGETRAGPMVVAGSTMS